MVRKNSIWIGRNSGLCDESFDERRRCHTPLTSRQKHFKRRKGQNTKAEGDLVCFSSLNLYYFPSYYIPRVIPSMEGAEQTSPCERQAPGGVSPGGVSWATPCCCWSTACSACCRCCGPRCCSLRQAESSGPAGCQLSHLTRSQTENDEYKSEKVRSMEQ